jgi:hypothetical protein
MQPAITGTGELCSDKVLIGRRNRLKQARQVIFIFPEDVGTVER